MRFFLTNLLILRSFLVQAGDDKLVKADEPVGLGCFPARDAATKAMVAHPYMKFAPAFFDLFNDSIMETLTRGDRTELALMRKNDMRNSVELYKIDETFYKDNTLGRSDRYYNTPETIGEFLKSKYEKPDILTAALEDMDKLFKPRQDYSKTDPMSQTMGSYYVMRRDEEKGIGFSFCAMYLPEVTSEARMKYALKLLQNGHGGLGERMVAWEAMRATSLETCQKYLETVVNATNDWHIIEDFYGKFAIPFMRARWRMTDEQHLAYMRQSKIWGIFVENRTIPDFFATAKKGQINAVGLAMVVEYVFDPRIENSQAAVIKKLKALFLSNTKLLDDPAVTQLEKQNNRFKKWLDSLIENH